MRSVKFLVIPVLLFLSSCATSEKIKLNGAGTVPAAQGKITVDRAKDQTTNLKVRIDHLAKPEKVRPDARSYVVWVRPDGGKNYLNIGTLRVDSNLEGKMRTNIPFEKFRLVVTPEPAANAYTPTGPAVLDQKVSVR